MPAQNVRFGLFQLDLKTGELFQNGSKIPLQEQPFQILKMLLERPGEVISREEIRRILWSDDTIVEFENSVHAAVKKLRVALGDSAEHPTYIETLPRKGYRFIVSVEVSAPETTGSQLRNGAGTSKPVMDHSHVEQDSIPTVESRETKKPWNRGGFPWRLIAMNVLLLALGTSIWIGRSRGTGTPKAPLALPFTTYAGWEVHPSFSPDGNQVAFVWGGDKGDNCDIYIKQIGTQSRRRLTTDPRGDCSPVWSPDGQSIAFVREVASGKLAVMLIPVNGGRERQIGELRTQDKFLNYRSICWHPDGKWLAVASDQESGHAPPSIYLLSAETGKTLRITRPLAESGEGASGSVGDTNPAFCLDGRSLVFVRFFGSGVSEIFLMRLNEGFVPEGEPRQLTFSNRLSVTPAWLPDGKSIIYASGSHFHSVRLWRISTSGPDNPEPVAVSGQGPADDPAISPVARRLVYSNSSSDINIWLNQIPHQREKSVMPGKLMASNMVQESVQYSPDGKAIAFVSYASGNAEIWVCDRDGSNPLQLTHLETRLPSFHRWSPDGRDIIFTVSSNGKENLRAVSARSGQIRELTNAHFNHKDPSYSRDGRSIYFVSDRTEDFQVWKMPAEGGDGVQITHKGGETPLESMDEKVLFYLKSKDSDFAELWKIPVGGGEESRVLEGIFHSSFDPKERGIYYVAQADPKETQFLFYDFATGKSKTLATTKKYFGWGFSVSPDEKWILSTQGDHPGASDLVLVENIR